LARIAEVNPTLNAVMQLRAETDLAEAEACDREVGDGHVRGPRHGAPSRSRIGSMRLACHALADEWVKGGVLDRRGLGPMTGEEVDRSLFARPRVCRSASRSRRSLARGRRIGHRGHHRTRTWRLDPSSRVTGSMELTDQPHSEQFLEDQINGHNMVRTGRRDFRPLAVYLRDEQGGIIAGLYGFTWSGWLEIKFVWVREDLLGRGHGRQLVEAAEAEALARGCERVWLESYTFQAPAFYQRLGYEVFGSLQDYPAPHGRVFLTRTL